MDGGQHGIEIEKDAARTAWLESQGYSVIRFWNNEVMGNIEGVLRSIREEAAALAAAPLYTSPSSEGEVGERSEPGGGGASKARAARQGGNTAERPAAPPSTSLREATSPSEEGEG